MANLANDRSPAWPVLGLWLGVRGGDGVKCRCRVQVAPRLRFRVRDETGCGWVAMIRVQKRAGLGLGLLCRLHLRKEHSSKSDLSSRKSSFVGETLGGDLVGLGLGSVGLGLG